MELNFKRSISVGNKQGKARDVAARMVQLGMMKQVNANSTTSAYTKYEYEGETLKATLYDSMLGTSQLDVYVADAKTYKKLRETLKLDRTGRLTD